MKKENQQKNRNIVARVNFSTQILRNLREYPKSTIFYFSFFLLTSASSKASLAFVFPSTYQILSILIAGIFIFLVLKYKKSFFDKNFFYVFLLVHVLFSILLIYNIYSIRIRGIDFFYFPTFACFTYLLSLLKWYSKQFIVKISNYIFFLYIIGVIIAFSINSFSIGILFLFLCNYHIIFMLLFLIFSSSNKNSNKLKNFQSIYLFVLGGISYPIVFLCLVPLLANIISK